MWLGCGYLEESRRQWRREGHDYSWDDLLKQAAEAKPFLCFLDPDDATFAQPGDLPSCSKSILRKIRASLTTYTRRIGALLLGKFGSKILAYHRRFRKSLWTFL